jgi:hypothetical protein
MMPPTPMMGQRPAKGLGQLANHGIRALLQRLARQAARLLGVRKPAHLPTRDGRVGGNDAIDARLDQAARKCRAGRRRSGRARS